MTKFCGSVTKWNSSKRCISGKIDEDLWNTWNLEQKETWIHSNWLRLFLKIVRIWLLWSQQAVRQGIALNPSWVWRVEREVIEIWRIRESAPKRALVPDLNYCMWIYFFLFKCGKFGVFCFNPLWKSVWSFKS